MGNPFEEAAKEEGGHKPQSREEIREAHDLANLAAEEGIDLKKLIGGQYKLITGLQAHLFEPDGTPKRDTKYADIKSYISSSMQLLDMLRKFQNALQTDEDFKRAELALEMTFEEIECPQFAEIFKRNIANLTEAENEAIRA